MRVTVNMSAVLQEMKERWSVMLGHQTEGGRSRVDLKNKWVVTNSQRFGRRLLHFWPLSTMYWPEACTARIHAQGKCTYMETKQIYTHTIQAHTSMHTDTHTQ